MKFSYLFTKTKLLMIFSIITILDALIAIRYFQYFTEAYRTIFYKKKAFCNWDLKGLNGHGFFGHYRYASFKTL